MKRVWIALTLVSGVAAGLMTVNVGKGNNHDRDPRSVIGLQISPFRLNLKGKNRDEVGLGSYLVNAVGDCNGCHSTSQYAPGHDPFQGQHKVVNKATYLKGGQAFGPFVSRDLRVDPDTGLPAGMTRDQFFAVLRHGTDFDHMHPQISPLLQVMPWPAFQNMTDQDIHAIYEYLRAVPPDGPLPMPM